MSAAYATIDLRDFTQIVVGALPWAALIVDVTGCIRAANAAACQLVQQPLETLLQQPLPELLDDPCVSRWQQLLGEAEQRRHASTQLNFVNGASTTALHCQAQSLDMLLHPFQSEQPWFALVLHPPVDQAATLASTLSSLVAACFTASDLPAFYQCLQHACATLQLSACWLLHSDHGLIHAWSYSPLDLQHQAIIEQYTAGPLGTLLAQPVMVGSNVGTPRAIAINDVLPANASTDVQTGCTQLALKLVSWRWEWVLPIFVQNRSLGYLLLSGPTLQIGDMSHLVMLGQLLGNAFERLMQPVAGGIEWVLMTRLLKSHQAITAATQLDQVLRIMCEQALVLTESTTAAVFMPVPGDHFLRCVMATGYHSNTLLGQQSAVAGALVDHLLQQDQGLLIGDSTHADAALFELLSSVAMQSAVLQPLRFQGRTVGLLFIGHHERHSLTSAHLSILEQYGTYAAVALENAQLHESVRRSEERYRTLFQNALEIVLTLDLDGYITAGNRTALQFLGLSPAELRHGSLRLTDLLEPGTAQWMQELQAQTLLGQPPLPVEIELHHPDGSLIVLEVSMQLFQERGLPSGVYIIGRDMSERRRQQRALTEQVAQLSALHRLSTALNTSLDQHHILDQALKALVDTLEFECISIYLIHPDEPYLEIAASNGVTEDIRPLINRAGVHTLIWNTWQTGRVHSTTTAGLPQPLRQAFTQLRVWSHLFVPLLSSSRALGVLAIGRADESSLSDHRMQVVQTLAAQLAQALEHVKLYAEVKQSAARISDLFENANDLIGTVAIDGKLLTLNRAALRFFGYTPADVAHLTLQHLLAPHEAASMTQTLEVLLQPSMPANGHEVRVIRHDGTLAILEIRSRVIDDEGVPTAIQFIARDITERRQLEEQLRQGEKLAALGQLVAGAAHELNNPLAVVLGTTQLLLRDPASAPFSDDIQNIEAAAQRAKHIVNQMLTFAREQDDVRGPVDVALLVKRVVQGIRGRAEQCEVLIHVQMPQNILPIWGDAYQLEQVLDNLVHNAIQALAESGKQPRRVTITVTSADNTVRINVVDNGPGISPMVLPRIFDPFFTTKEVGRGTGLGLSLVYGIVEKHGGSIRAESEFGQGATFVVDLPASHMSTTEAVPIVIGGAVNSSILVVEDQGDVRAVVERALAQHGYQVDAVDNAEEALTRALNKHYDLVITDLHMPGMSGTELFDQLYEVQPHLNWVFITGDTMSAASEALIKHNGTSVLAKPFTLEELWDAVATSLLAVQQHQPSPAA